MLNEPQYDVEEEAGLGDLLNALKRRKRLVLITASITFVIGAILIFAWPTSYTSTATILLEEPEVPAALVQTTVTTFAAQQIQYINQRVMTRTNLASIIEKFDLYVEKRRYTPTLLLTDEVQKNIKLDLITVELTDPSSSRPVVSTIAFKLGFEDPSPATAQKVANELVSLYMEENVRLRTVQTVETRQFLGVEAERLEAEVKALEQEVARFKEENEASLPDMMNVNLAASQRIDTQLAEIDRELSRIKDTRIIIDSQLAQIDPTQSIVLPDGSVAMSPESQLKSLQTRLATMKGLYSEDHPDVLRARREIDALKAETGLTADLTDATAALVAARSDLAIARENYGADHPEVSRLEKLVAGLEDSLSSQRNDADPLLKPDNPAYIQLAAQKETLAANEVALNLEKKSLRARLAEYEANMLKTPGVEQQLRSWERQLQSATAQYYALREREFGAEMGEALESQSKGERFVLVEPANMPLEPSKPNRTVLLTLLIVVAPIFGLAMVPLREAMDSSIWGADTVSSIQGGPPIAEIPLIATLEEQLRASRIRLTALISAPVAVLALMLAVHFLVRPLDVLWFVVLRKLGM